jgi:nitroreductase
MKDLIEALSWRYATKVFDPEKPLSEEKLDCLLEALRLSASSFGLQPWRFVVLEDRERRAALVEHSWGQRQVVDASALIVMCRPVSFGEADVDRLTAATAEVRGVDVQSLEPFAGMMKGFLARLDAPALRQWMDNQIYVALGNLLAACAIEGVDACPMEGFSAQEYDAILGLGDLGLASVVLCPVGYRSESDKYAGLAKVRYAAADVVVRI